MANREKDQSDFDLDTFVDLFDTAMTSENPVVKQAFNNLLMVAALAHAKDSAQGLRRGPLRRLVEDVNDLSRTVNRLQQNQYGPGEQMQQRYVTPVTVQPVPIITTHTNTSSNTSLPGANSAGRSY